MNIEELKRLAEAATPGQWRIRPYIPGIDCGVDGMFQVCHHASARDAAYIAAANPAAMLELIDYVEYLRGKNREHFDACTGCDEELKSVSKQRDELLAALKVFADKYNSAPDGDLGIGLVNGDFFRAIDAIARAEAT